MTDIVDVELWKKIKHKWHYGPKGGVPGQWNARKAQLAVQEYKRRGGKYKTRTKSRKNSLVKWTKEDWGYIDNKPGNRYLPLKVRSILTDKEKQIENQRKRRATKLNKQYAQYSASVLRKFNKLV